jgi:hypothetical protein
LMIQNPQLWGSLLPQIFLLITLWQLVSLSWLIGSVVCKLVCIITVLSIQIWELSESVWIFNHPNMGIHKKQQCHMSNFKTNTWCWISQEKNFDIPIPI